ncbi:dnaJ homolog subfamily C member 8 [Aplysia californica]|uniref:DnaJ homolog subfamily C member 8 n=1 Tax=Aplysia californica TaxID=6500 RepID=A0ABM0JMH6_APLCA|nr:dnaJ homolog subfamily C member 8 [Aplysia californica]
MATDAAPHGFNSQSNVNSGGGWTSGPSTSSSQGVLPNNNHSEAAFSEYYEEVKAIEKRDAVLTSKQQMDRLTRPGATYFNLNPYDVLQIDPDTPLSDVKKKYRQMSILVHPDKNQDDQDRAQKSFEAVNKAYKTLENEEGLKRCREVVEEAKTRTDEMIRLKKKQLKKEGKPQDVPEDNVDKYRHAVYVQTCKLFADLERLRQEREAKDMHERKRKAEEEAVEEEKKQFEKEWQKNFEASRSGRVDSWRTWNKKPKKSSKGNLKPPKLKAEKR